MSTSGGVAQALAHLGEPRGCQLGDVSAKGSSRNGVNVVEVDDAIRWYAVIGGCEIEFGHESSDNAGDRATTTDQMRSATGSRVSTSTGRAPQGVDAKHTSPRCITPPNLRLDSDSVLKLELACARARVSGGRRNRAATGSPQKFEVSS